MVPRWDPTGGDGSHLPGGWPPASVPTGAVTACPCSGAQYHRGPVLGGGGGRTVGARHPWNKGEGENPKVRMGPPPIKGCGAKPRAGAKHARSYFPVYIPLTQGSGAAFSHEGPPPPAPKPHGTSLSLHLNPHQLLLPRWREQPGDFCPRPWDPPHTHTPGDPPPFPPPLGHRSSLQPGTPPLPPHSQTPLLPFGLTVQRYREAEETVGGRALLQHREGTVQVEGGGTGEQRAQHQQQRPRYRRRRRKRRRQQQQQPAAPRHVPHRLSRSRHRRTAPHRGRCAAGRGRGRAGRAGARPSGHSP